MNPQYLAYLETEQWKSKREERLRLGHYKCSVCGSNEKLRVHHLTYARIFHEDMADLLPLCDYHHKAVEQIIQSGELGRNDHPLFLATETVKLLLVYGNENMPNYVYTPQPETPKEIQARLMSEQWFCESLKLGRKAFKRECKKRFGRKQPRLMANAFVCYDRRLREV